MVSSQKVNENAEGATRPTAGDEACEFTSHAEGGRVPPFIEKLRNVTAATKEILEKVGSFVEESFAGSYEIYDIQLKSLNKRMVLQVFIDSEKGITIKDCETVSRAVSLFLDETDPIHFRYDLEVSSPGVERVMKREKDYQRHIGKLIRWVLAVDGGGKREVFSGRLQEFSPEKIIVSQEKGTREFPLSGVIEARSVFEFPKKARG